MTIFTSGYSEELLFYTVDKDYQELFFDDQVDVDAQFSFGYVSKKYGSIYFVHEVNDYDGTPNTGAVSRWKIDSTRSSMNGHSLTKQEVRDYLIMARPFFTKIEFMSFLHLTI